MNWFKTSLELEGPNRSAEGTVKKNWLDPVVAVRTLAPLGGKWNLSLYGDIGGFGVGSKITWQAIGAVTYDISKKMRAGGGWRYFKVNYRDGDFLYDVAESGPIIVFRTDF